MMPGSSVFWFAEEAVTNPPTPPAGGQVVAPAQSAPAASRMGEKKAVSPAAEAIMARDDFDKGLRGGMYHV
jgi:hypothetical protein